MFQHDDQEWEVISARRSNVPFRVQPSSAGARPGRGGHHRDHAQDPRGRLRAPRAPPALTPSGAARAAVFSRAGAYIGRARVTTPRMGRETVTSSRFNPVKWAVAIVIVAVFGGVTYRVVTSCEPSQFEILKQLKVSLGGCAAPNAEKTEPREAVSSVTVPSADAPGPTKPGRAKEERTPAPGATRPAPSREAMRPSAATRPPVGNSSTVTNPTATSKAVEELQGLRATAKHITSWTQRDEQLVTIVRRAIDKREYRAAIDVASDITSSITRDKMLAHIACYALHLSGDRIAAEAAASAVTSRISRDEIYRDIVTWAASESESNDIPCAKL